MKALKRFALVVTNDPLLTRWQVHKPDCPDVSKLGSGGSFAHFLGAESAEALCNRELGTLQQGFNSTD
jgi:hypothetical protein